MRLADGYDPLLFDLDGVLFRGTEVVPGGPETLAALRRFGDAVRRASPVEGAAHG